MALYRDVRESLDTGDLVLFTRKGGLSTAIRALTLSRWTHLGMVLRLAPFDVVFLWEATLLDDIKDVLHGEGRAGVQLVPLRERLRAYDGEAALRRLVTPRAPAMDRALCTLRRELHGRPFETSRLELLRSIYDGPFGANAADLTSVFCSELVAEAYQRIGLLPAHPPSNEYTPKDFSSEGEELTLLRGARLEPELPLSLAPDD